MMANVGKQSLPCNRPLALALGVAVASCAGSALAQQQDAGVAGDAEAQASVEELTRQLQALKASYAQEVRRLRELDMQVQALQARLGGKVPAAPSPAPAPAPAPAQPDSAPAAAAPAPAVADAAPSPPAEGYASSATEAAQAREAARRSVDDVKQQQAALFNRRLTIENGVTYNRYDRKQLTLNGFLALDAIFLGNIAIQNVESDTLTYNLAARWGVSPRWTLNVDVPYLGRKTVYQKGGAGGAAAAIAQEETTGGGLGDITVSANYKLVSERPHWPETVLTMGVTVPTGREPYGLDWVVLERDDDQFIRFAVPGHEPTGNGVYQANIGVSMVKTVDPAILFANFGYVHSFERGFGDIDSNPDTVNPGDVQLGKSFYFGAGVAFAFNERTSLSLSFSDKVSSRARTRYGDGPWTKIIGSDANAASLNLGVTYAINPHTTVVGMLGLGLTPDAPDYTLSLKVPYSL